MQMKLSNSTRYLLLKCKSQLENVCKLSGSSRQKYMNEFISEDSITFGDMFTVLTLKVWENFFVHLQKIRSRPFFYWMKRGIVYYGNGHTVESRHLELGYLEFCETRSVFLNTF